LLHLPSTGRGGKIGFLRFGGVGLDEVSIGKG
jgi:hypothetical protein